MSSERRLVVLVLSVIVSGVWLTESSAKSSEEEDQDYAINEFFNTTDAIWVLNTTQPNAQKCRMDVNYNITANITYFNRSYEENGLTITEELQGKFGVHDDHGNVFDMIEVSGEKRGVFEELLEYASKNYTCGVVKVFAWINDTLQIWRDVRVRNLTDSATSIEENCTNYFDNIVKKFEKNWTSPYDATCK